MKISYLDRCVWVRGGHLRFEAMPKAAPQNESKKKREITTQPVECRNLNIAPRRCEKK
jgi:hypothetical protein